MIALVRNSCKTLKQGLITFSTKNDVITVDVLTSSAIIRMAFVGYCRTTLNKE